VIIPRVIESIAVLVVSRERVDAAIATQHTGCLRVIDVDTRWLVIGEVEFRHLTRSLIHGKNVRAHVQASRAFAQVRSMSHGSRRMVEFSRSGLVEVPEMSGVRAPPTAARARVKALYEIGEIPAVGCVPKQMYAWTIRRERHGTPRQALEVEVLDVPRVGPGEVLLLVMAAGINYNSVWASLGTPVSVLDIHGKDFHVPGSDASGVVWAVGEGVQRWKVGDEVVVHCNQDDGDDEECNGGDPMLSPSQRIWGYETPHGSFAQFTVVQGRQLVPRPRHLSWEASACYMLTLATAYRMLFGHPPHVIRPGSNALVWGAAGGLGSMALQLIKIAGGSSVGVISDDCKRDFVLGLGARGVVNRREFNCWGPITCSPTSDEYGAYMKEVRSFGKAVWAQFGAKIDPDIVVEHPGESTFPVSCFVAKRGGMVVICAGTSGYQLTLDARFLWMRQKRVQGSHFATLKQAALANQLVIDKCVDPCLSDTVGWEEIPLAHERMMNNQHPPGNMAVLIQAPGRGLNSLPY
jgi:crotonyl-CoA carboxylase/reductase